MNQINKSDCVEVGYIQKPHGLKGEIILVFGREFEETIAGTDFLFIDIDGGLVPFYIEEEGLNFKSGESAICKLEFVDTLTSARNMVGCKVFVSGEAVAEAADQEFSSPLTGMRVYDQKFGDIGLIGRVDDYSGNLVITVLHTRNEILIPLSDEIITRIDEAKREIYLDCPNGLIEIYLD